MSHLMERSAFRRRNGLLWRDTGVHVLVLPPELHGRVVVLGGGSADLWRRLEEARRLSEILPRGDGQGDAPDRGELEDCLAEMLGLGVLVRVGGGPR